MEDENIKRDMELYAVDRLNFILENTSQPIITVNIAMLQRMGYKQITTDPAIGEKVFGIDAAVFMTMQELGAFETVNEKFSKDLGEGRLDTTFADLMMYRKIMEPTADYFTVTIDRSYAEKLINRVREGKDKRKLTFVMPSDINEITKVSFDDKNSKIKIGSQNVKIPQNTNQFDLCSVLLKDEISQKKIWEYDEINETLQGKFADNGKLSKYYGAAIQVNLKVEMETGIKEFFKKVEPHTKKLQLNPSLI